LRSALLCRHLCRIAQTRLADVCGTFRTSRDVRLESGMRTKADIGRLPSSHLRFAAVAFSAVVSLMQGFFLFNAATGLVELVSIGPAAPAALLTSIATSGATHF
jgi:hypothetical protein